MAQGKTAFQKTLNHQQPDKIVVDMGSTAVTGIHVLTLSKLRDKLGLEKRPVRVIEPYQMLGEVEQDLIDVLGIDVVGVSGKNNMFGFDNQPPLKMWLTPWGQELLVPEQFNVRTDTDGSTLIFPEGDTSVAPSGRMPATGYFFDAIIRQEPIDDNKLKVEDNLEEFSFITDDELDYWETEVNKAFNTGKGVIANFGGSALGDIALVPGMNLKYPKGIRDISEWYISTIMRIDYVKEIFDRQTDIAINNFEKIYQRVGNKVDAVFTCGTDFGTQDSTFCAPEQFDETWLPYYKRLNDWIHQNTEWKTFKHSCGAVEGFMSRFIDAGFDIINPVQVNATGMDIRHLKETYGNDLVFWGGGVDTQKILPFATPEEVKREVIKTCEILSKDGGFVFNTVHNVQANVPVENLLAMFEGISEFNNFFKF